MAGMSEAGPRKPVRLSALGPYLRPHLAVLTAIAALSLTAAAGLLAQPQLIRLVLDRIGVSKPIVGPVAALVALMIVVALLQGVRGFLLQRTAEGLVLTTRRRLADHLLRLPIAEYDRRRTGDLLSRMGADTTMLRVMVTAGLLELATGFVVGLGAATMMVLIDPVMFLVTVAALGSLTGTVLASRRIRGLAEQSQARLGEMTAATERAIRAARTIRAAQAEDREAATVTSAAEATYRAGVRIGRAYAVIGPAVNTVLQGGFLVVLAIGGSRVAAGAIGLGDLVAFVFFLFLLMMPVGQAVGAYTMLQTGLGALQRIEDILALPVESAGDRPATVVTPVAAAAAIELVDVDFAYPDAGSVLRSVSFTVPRGSRTALVGPSGAGKSTVLALVERFYDASAGAVRVNGVDVRDQSRSELRRQLGYVEQDAPVLAGSIRDNLRLAAPAATDAELMAVLATVNLTDLAERTREGLDAQVGESGVLLSGGERQRLAIARTLLSGAPILLMDEPTSNLDARNEQALRAAINAAAQQRTLLVVAHRLSTVVDADQIVVLDQGRVVAVGGHRELAGTNPLYRELAAHQLLIA